MSHDTLIDAETLAAHLDDPNWVVLDCRFDLGNPSAGREAWLQAHLPGAVYADLDRDMSRPPGPEDGRHPLPDRDELAGRFSAWGIGSNTQVVAYDDQGGAFASRLWWLSRWLGHRATAVLDGGLSAWRAAGLPLEAGETRNPRHEFEAGAPLEEPVTTDDVEAICAGQRPAVLLDARTPERFRGEQDPVDPVPGHVPGALNAPFGANLGPDGRFLPVAALRARFDGYGTEQVIHMCGSGVTACHNMLAMEHAGLQGSRLYPGSWSEWIRDPERPVERG
jgi:thiosulfate/3-mercaptopyruvate sulfurtransferase